MSDNDARSALPAIHDGELAALVDAGWERFRAARAELTPLAVEQGRRLLAACLPAEARYVEFYSEEWDNGVFLEFGVVRTEDRELLGHFLDLRNITAEQEAQLSAFGADLTELWGPNAAGIDLVTGEQIVPAAAAT